MKNRVGLFGAICASLCALGSVPTVHAQSYPTRAVRVIVPFAPGGGTDFIARVVTQKLSESWRQPVIVDNRPGGTTIVGAEIVARAPPDGYTLLVTPIPFSIVPSLAKLSYDPLKDFEHIALFNTAPLIFIVNPNVPAKSVRDLVALAKVKPGALNFGSAGIGTLPHIEGELLKARAQIDMNHVPYRGGGLALTGLLGGQIQVLFTTVTQMLPNVREGRVRGLAIAGAARSKLAPDLPTMAESGLDQFVVTSITVIVAPPGTPIDIRRRLNQAVVAALASAEVQRALSTSGGEARPSSPEDTASWLAGEQQRWARIIEATKVSVD